MSEADLLLLPGDGISPEVVPEVIAAAEQTLEAANRRFSRALGAAPLFFSQSLHCRRRCPDE